MDMNTILIGLAGVMGAATPIVFAAIGETFTEKAGWINLRQRVRFCFRRWQGLSWRLFQPACGGFF
jgi:hypothetical protein